MSVCVCNSQSSKLSNCCAIKLQDCCDYFRPSWPNNRRLCKWIISLLIDDLGVQRYILSPQSSGNKNVPQFQSTDSHVGDWINEMLFLRFFPSFSGITFNSLFIEEWIWLANCLMVHVWTAGRVNRLCAVRALHTSNNNMVYVLFIVL